ncbi:NADPH-dependent F420 reductase [Liquorilactobacillus nagelii]|uniref:NADPH-dependent F420 reductase n=1 Tax=Liquorilactobacillus nagelii TaxID=82688 RepID=UPI0039EB7C30
MKLGIIGAGKLGMVLGQLAQQAGYQVLIAGSGDPSRIELIVATLLPQAQSLTSAAVAQQADLVILALPLHRYRMLAAADFADKIAIDATNYWEPTDGPAADLLISGTSSSEMIQQQLKSSQVIKAFNHIGYHNLLDLAAPVGSSGRKSVALAGDQLAAKNQVATIINQMGFDPLDIGPLAAGKLLEPGSPAFGASVSRTKLQFLIQKYAVDSKTD